MRRGRKRRGLSMTSLIDVIFLLLLFFMLTSTFSRFAEVELTTARAAIAAPPGDVKPVFVQLGPEDLTVNARPATLADLAPLLRADHPPGTPIPVIVALKPQVNAQRLTDLLVALKRVGGAQPTILGAS